MKMSKWALALCIGVSVSPPIVAASSSYVIGIEQADLYPMHDTENGQFTGAARAILRETASRSNQEAVRHRWRGDDNRESG